MKGIIDRMAGKMDDGIYATIDAVARHLRVTYQHAQRSLLGEYRGGNLLRERIGRRLVYTSKQRGLVLESPRYTRRAQHGTRSRGPRNAATEQLNQRDLF